MTDLSVRPATAADVAAWRALRLEGIAQHPEAFILTEDEARAISAQAEAQRLDHGDRFLAFLGDTLVGLAGVHRNTIPRGNHRAEIGPFYVVATARGAGVADGLMAAIFDWALANGVWQLELYVNRDNTRAIAFYARHGFVHSGEIPNAIRGAAGLESDAIMVRTAHPA